MWGVEDAEPARWEKTGPGQQGVNRHARLSIKVETLKLQINGQGLINKAPIKQIDVKVNVLQEINRFEHNIFVTNQCHTQNVNQKG